MRERIDDNRSNNWGRGSKPKKPSLLAQSRYNPRYDKKYDPRNDPSVNGTHKFVSELTEEEVRRLHEDPRKSLAKLNELLGIASKDTANEPGIVINSPTNVAVPGTQTEYAVNLGQRLEPREWFTYRWTIINDPEAIKREREQRGFFGDLALSESVELGTTREGRKTIEWDFPGIHTVRVEVYVQGELTSSHSYIQEVKAIQTVAAEAFAEQASPTLEPDVYLAQLELQKQILANQGVEPKQLERIDAAINKAEKLLGVNADNPQGNAIPLKTLLIPTAQPQPVSLQLYLKPISNQEWAIVDLTNPERTEIYSEKASEPEEAISKVWQNYIKNNPHPAGEIVTEFPALEGEGSKPVRQAYSDGISTLGKVREWFSRVGLLTGLGAITLAIAPVPGSRLLVPTLLITSGASGVAAGGLNITERIQRGNFEWDSETALDLLDIASGLAVGTGTVLSLGSKAANITKLKNAVLISGGIETGTDLTGGVVLSAQHYRRIEEIRNSNLPEAQKQAQIKQELLNAAGTGGLILLGTVVPGRVKGKQGDFLDISPDGIRTSARPGKNGIRITSENLEEFRSIGLSKADIETLNNPNTTKAEKNALYAKRDAKYKELYQAYGQEGIEQLLQKLGAKGLRQIYGATGVDGLKKIGQIIELEKRGKVKGFDDWIEFLNSGNRGDPSIRDVVGELDITKGVATDLAPNEVINLGGDNQVVANAQGERPKSFDLAIEDKQTGELLRNIEVYRPRRFARADNHSDFKQGINHAIDKATLDVKDARGNTVDRIPNPEVKGKVEAAINVNIPEAGTVAGDKYFGESGTYGTGFGKGGGDLYQDIINEQLVKNPYAEKYLDRVHIIDRKGNLRAVIEKSGNGKTGYNWTIERYR